MHIADFHYHRPGTLEEALHLLDTKPDGVLLADGTDLLVDSKQRDSLVHKSIRSRRNNLTKKPYSTVTHCGAFAWLNGRYGTRTCDLRYVKREAHTRQQPPAPFFNDLRVCGNRQRP